MRRDRTHVQTARYAHPHPMAWDESLDRQNLYLRRGEVTRAFRLLLVLMLGYAYPWCDISEGRL